MEEKPWCKWQIKCKEDEEIDSWTCTASLASGRANKCHYTKNDLKPSNWNPKKIILSKQNEGLGQCVDYESTEVEKIVTKGRFVITITGELNSNLIEEQNFENVEVLCSANDSYDKRVMPFYKKVINEILESSKKIVEEK